ncbi:hypothetical protein H0H87_001341 [Tephrocybe sp. NHM501043]|nr:hypothetical protein H0H87_001341 [Tephrocybe sp. NHM501043]
MRHSWAVILLTRGAALANPLHALYTKHPRTHPAEPGSPDFWWRLLISAVLVLAGGVFAGLTLGLMGLDELHLRVLASSSSDYEEQENAKKGT